MANSIPSPPRYEGDVGAYVAASAQWQAELYKALVLQNQFVTRSEQFIAEDFDPSSLPDPASSTIATAQQTANEAYGIASNALALAQARQEIDELFGTVTISDTAISAAVSLGGELNDTDYQVMVCASTSSGAPAADAFVVTGITSKTTTGFTVNIATAPTAGKSVTLVWRVLKAL